MKMRSSRKVSVAFAALGFAMALAFAGLVLTACEGPVGPQGLPGPEGPEGPTGPIGPEGPPGTASVVTIGTNGNWYINGGDTGRPAVGQPNSPGSVVTICPDTDNWLIDGEDTGIPARGQDGVPGLPGTPGSVVTVCPDTDNWLIDGEDTGILARGQDGTELKIGPPPYYYWYINGERTGIPARGQYGAPGPWFVAVESISLDDFVLYMWEPKTLAATISPPNASIRTVLWTSDNPSVASVNMFTGIITAHRIGTAEITAFAMDGGRTATATATVELPRDEDGNVLLPEGSLSEQLGLVSWVVNNGLHQSGDTFLIEISADEGIGSLWLSFGGVPVGIILRGSGEMRTVNFSGGGLFFDVGSGVTLTLDSNITLNGIGNNSTSLVMVGGGGALIMNAGSRITGNVNASGNGGGVLVGYQGTFTMNGGEIFGNSAWNGGGVFVSGGTFNMISGIIHGSNAAEGLRNTAVNNGAALANSGIAQYGSSDDGFTMLGNLPTTDYTIWLENGVWRSIQPPAITAQPAANQDFSLGDPVPQLSVAATAVGGGALSFQWFQATSATAAGTAISGATNAAFTPAITARGAFHFYVVVTNTNTAVTGEQSATATSARATIFAFQEADNLRVITPIDPPDRFLGIASSGPVTFTLGTTAEGEFVDLRMTGRTADSHGLDIRFPALIAAGYLTSTGQYTVRMVGRGGDNAAGQIMLQGIESGWNWGTLVPLSPGAFFTSSRTFTMQADPSPWDGGLGLWAAVRITTNPAGANADIILTSVVIENALGDVVWNLAYAFPPPVNAESVAIQVSGETVATLSIGLGDTVTLAALVLPDNPFHDVTWDGFNANVTRQNTGMGEAVIQGASAGTATITATTTNNITAQVLVTVHAAADALEPVITTQPQSQVVPFVADIVPLTVAASVLDGGTLTYQWYRAETATGAGTAIPGATASTLVPEMGGAEVLWFYVIVTNTNNAVVGNQVATTVSARAEVVVFGTESYFYLDLANVRTYHDTSTTQWSAALPVATFADGTLTWTFGAEPIGNGQRGLIDLTPVQVARLMHHNGSITIEIDGEADQWNQSRIFLVNPMGASNWNATSGSGWGDFTSIRNSTQTFTANKSWATLTSLMLQTYTQGTVFTIRSIRITLND